MNECFKCGISGEKARLFDVIASEGIVKICSRCFSEEKLPLIKRPTTSQLKDSEKQHTYQERIKAFSKAPMQNDLHRKENVNLRDIVDRNLKIDLQENVKPRPDLVENFHWVIMRARRAKHISRMQFAKDLGESETLIKMVEQGVLPEDDNKIINKIETYLSINLRKQEFMEPTKKKGLGFDSVSVQNLTISDLKEIRDKGDEDIFANTQEVWEGDIEGDSLPSTTPQTREIDDSINDKKFRANGYERGKLKTEKEEEDKDLSQKDIDDLIFGK
ncbi:hypothetical protein KAT24_01300 [Candidatus Pacearchaeota archaeon]|nr:hypothetical protein [Candidatus Pacearchaeota archaeon]